MKKLIVNEIESEPIAIDTFILNKVEYHFINGMWIIKRRDFDYVFQNKVKKRG